tara:strand:- start:6634 stop:7200 length:567 start_codon:yes stop_codon:yes gene_type:complete
MSKVKIFMSKSSYQEDSYYGNAATYIHDLGYDTCGPTEGESHNAMIRKMDECDLHVIVLGYSSKETNYEWRRNVEITYAKSKDIRTVILYKLKDSDIWRFYNYDLNTNNTISFGLNCSCNTKDFLESSALLKYSASDKGSEGSIMRSAMDLLQTDAYKASHTKLQCASWEISTECEQRDTNDDDFLLL